MSDTMRAWEADRWGGPEVLSLERRPRPVRMPGQVLVQVHAAALNFADLVMLAGRYQVRAELPFFPGAELAGVVADADAGSGFAPGDRVAAQVWSGAFSEYAVVDAARLLKVPAGLDLRSAAAVPVAFTTARIALHGLGAPRRHGTVLVHAAAGGVGVAAVQLARAAGATVIATAGSGPKLELATRLGAHHTINYRSGDWLARVRELAPNGVDLVVDPVGGDVTQQSVRCLAWRGEIALVGFAAGVPGETPPNQLLVRAARAQGVYWSPENDGPVIREIQEALLAACARGELVAHLDQSFPLSDLPAALARVASGASTGKVVLDLI